MHEKFKRSLKEIRKIVAATAKFFEENGVDPALRNKVDLATEELFVNMVTYNTETREDILIEMKQVGNGVKVSLTDFDVERFDPTEVARDVDIDSPLDERDPGGLGLYLVMKMVDSIHYEYKNRQSKISFTTLAE